MDRYRQELGRQFCRRCEYCQPCPQGVMITPAMGYGVIVGRMSAKTAVSFASVPMNTVPKCVNCGLCVTRCPYNLPIPEMLKKHYDMYEGHCREFAKE
jgi:predicted aldo/keto reductase-like oxidoreductase